MIYIAAHQKDKNAKKVEESKNQDILKRESGFLLANVLTLWGGSLAIVYGGELLYLRIWCDLGTICAHYVCMI